MGRVYPKRFLVAAAFLYRKENTRVIYKNHGATYKKVYKYNVWQKMLNINTTSKCSIVWNNCEMMPSKRKLLKINCIQKVLRAKHSF